MSRRTLPALLLAGLLVLGAGLGPLGCTRKVDQGGTQRSRIDRALMACLGAQRAYHRQADVHLAAGDTPAAIRSIEQILGMSCIQRKNPEVQEAVLDAYGRLARLHLKLGQMDQATQRVNQGLRRPGPPSFFRANLLMVQGDLLDAQAEKLDQSGKKKAANQLRRKAIESFERSAKMNRKLLEDLVR